jgi:dipeptidyl-peptidase-4
MKNSGKKQIILSISFIFLMFHVNGQNYTENEASITGWTDDSHYKIVINENGHQITRSVDIRSGKSVDLLNDKSEVERFEESMPSGTSLSLTDDVSPDLQKAVLLRNNDLYLFRKGDTNLKKLTNDPVPEVNARFSPEGSKIAYTKNKDLYVYDLNAGKEIRITNDATDRIYNGYSAWVYMEEILERSSHYAAFWWAPDGNKLAYLRTDETDVPVFNLVRLDEGDGLHGTLETTPYPKPGDPNPRVKMGIADVNTASTVWVKTDYSVDQYIAWPFWTPDSRKLAIQVVNRDQNDLKILLADSNTGDFDKIYEESTKTWLEFKEDIYVMLDNSGFIIRSNKNDWDNLYYYDWNGTLRSQLTDFQFRVTSIDRIDERRKLVYFTADGEESTDSHAFRVGLDGKNLLQISKGPGIHSISISPEGSYFTDTWSSISDRGGIVAYDKNGKKLRDIYKFTRQVKDSVNYSRSELVKIPTSDGLFNMPAIITYPAGFDATKKYPVIFKIYGGPDYRNVYNRWKDQDPDWYSDNGIVVFTVDHRGSGQFGKKGLDYLYRNLGKWEILDYSDAVKWLNSKPWVDASKMGITGSSYGGYMTCLALTKGANFWTHGFGGSPVTDWRLYDDIYTERFMDKPQDNPEGYKNGSVLSYVKDYKGSLYVTHGDVDDNVHMQNSIQLISRLEDEGKRFLFLIYPDNRHGIQGLKALHYRNEEHNFWLKEFFGK